MSIEISNQDYLFKISGIINTSYHDNFYHKNDMFDRVCFHLFGMERLTTKISSCFKSWLQIVFNRIKNNKDYNYISYSEIMENSNVKFSIGTCSKLFKTLSAMNIIKKNDSIGKSSKIEIDIDTLVSLFNDSQEDAEKDVNKIVKHFKDKYYRRKRYAVGKNICEAIDNPRERFDTLVKCTFNRGEAFVYDLIHTFYVRRGHLDYHITHADVMTVMSAIVSRWNFETSEDWDDFVYFKLTTNYTELQKLIDAIKRPTIHNTTFKTDNYFKLVKESYLDSNCSYYRHVTSIIKEDLLLMKRK